MKYSFLFGALLGLSACVSTQAKDPERAYSECRTMPGKAQRDACIAEIIQRAERARNAAAERQRRSEARVEEGEDAGSIAQSDTDD